MKYYLFKIRGKNHNYAMSKIDEIKEIIRNIEMNSTDGYYYEVYTEKLVKAVRRNIDEITQAIAKDGFTPGEILYIAEISPQYTSLTGTSELIDALSEWLLRNERDTATNDIKGYIEEARKTYSSLFGI